MEFYPFITIIHNSSFLSLPSCFFIFFSNFLSYNKLLERRVFVQDFTTQVLATLVSSAILFIFSQLLKWIKKIPIKTWYNFSYTISLFLTHVLNVQCIMMHIKLLVNLDYSLKYLLFIFSLAVCVYNTIDLSVFIRKKLFNK